MSLAVYLYATAGRRRVEQSASKLLDLNKDPRHDAFAGKIDGYDVVLDQGGVSIRGGDLLRGVQCHPRPTLEYFEHQRVLTGDEAFDDKVLLLGAEREVAAHMSADVRAILLRGVLEMNPSLRFDHGAVVLNRAVSHASADKLAEQVRSIVRDGAVLTAPDPLAALERNAREDPLSEVRLRNLKQLLAHHADQPACDRALHQALKDHHVAPRLLAARALKSEGLTALKEMIAADDSTAELRTAALQQLAADGDPDAVWPVVQTALGSAAPFFRAAAIRSAGALLERAPAMANNHEVLQSLLASLSARAPAEVACALATVLGKFPSQVSEEPLLQLLAHEHDSVIGAAAKSLGVAGTVRAVPALLAVPKLMRSSHVNEAARNAARSIQARLAGAEAGQISLVDSPDPRGALSLAEPPDEAPKPGVTRSPKRDQG